MKNETQMIAEFQGVAKGTIHVIVGEYDVATMSQKGYSLVAVLYADRVVGAKESEEVPVTDPGYSSPNRTTTKNRTVCHVVREPRFLMRLDGDSALAEKEGLLAAANERADHLTEKLHDCQKRADALEKEQKLLSEQRDTAHKNYLSSVNNYQLARDLVRRLEGDIAKIRQAVGDLRMKEILDR